MSLGASVFQHPPEHYRAPRNWAIHNLSILQPWQLHLDADECLVSELLLPSVVCPMKPNIPATLSRAISV
jgi:hypothetical protein